MKYFNLAMSQTHRWGVPDAAGGADAAGLSDTFLYWGIGEYIFCIGGMLEKNYLKFSQIFSNLHFFCKILQKNSGVPDAAGLSDTFLVLEILVEKKLSQIISFFLKFSNFLGIHFFVLAMAENYLKLSLFFSNFLIFSNYLKFSHLFVSNCLNFFNQIFAPNDGVQIGWGVQVGSGCRIQSLYWWHIGKKCSTRSQIFWNLCTFLFSLDFHFSRYQV